MPTNRYVASSRTEERFRLSPFVLDARARLIAMPDIPIMDTVPFKSYVRVCVSSSSDSMHESRQESERQIMNSSDIPQRCRLCGERRDETHACGDMKKKIDSDFTMLLLKRVCVALVVLLYGVAAIVAGVALTTAVALAVMVVTFPVIRRMYNNRKFGRGKPDDRERSYISAINEVTERVRKVANKVGWVGVVTVRYDNTADGRSALAYVEPVGRDEIAVYVSEDFLTELTSDEQDSILAHEIGHMTNRRPRQVSILLRGLSVAAGIAVGSIVSAEGGALILSATVMVLVAVPLYLTGQALSRREERRADAIAYRHYPEVYPRALRTVLGTGYRPGQHLPFHFGDILEEHPSYLNRMESIRRIAP